MHRFWASVIEPTLARQRPAVIVEIGAAGGAHTRRLLAFCQRRDATLHAIDPAPGFDVAAWRAEYGARFVFHQARSLDVLPGLGGVDAVLIDGDHNWYTVFHELRALEAVAQGEGRPFPLVFLHDIGWPYGRRDLYYHPPDIPERYRKPHGRRGIVPGVAASRPSGGFNPHLEQATEEGGTENGVLTAVEDFLRGRETTIDFVGLPGFHGLGILVPTTMPDGEGTARGFVRGLGEGRGLAPVLETVEEGRVALAIRALERGQLLAAEREMAERAEEAARRERAELGARLGAVEASLAESHGRERALAERVAAAERERERAARRAAAVAADLAATRTERDRAEREGVAREARLAAALAAVAAGERALADVSTRLATVEDALRSESARREELDARLVEAEAARARSTGEAAAAEAERRRTEERRTRLELALRAAERERRWTGDALRPRLVAAREHLDGLNDGLTDGLPWFAEKTRERLFAVEDRVGAARAELRDALDALEEAERGPTVVPGASGAVGVLTAAPSGQLAEAAAVDVVVCVRDALEDTRRCLASLARRTDERHRLILVDDGSGEETRRALARFAGGHPRAVLIRNEEAVGYTKAANQGLRRSAAEVVVLLNSDTVVTPGWLDRLVECLESNPTLGIVGPLSNAASWQSVPELYGDGGDWATNPPPPGWGPDEVATVVATVSSRAFPRVAFVNGFCFAVRRGVIEAIGLLDEAAFPDGYGEENDYCLRAAAAGFGLAIADHAYVWHAKSKSYSHERRRELSKRGGTALRAKHGAAVIEAGVARLRAEPALAEIREGVGRALRETSPLAVRGLPRVLFLLPVRGGGGGATSIIQEAHGLRRLGVAARVAVSVKHFPIYRATYPAFVGEEDLFFFYRSEGELFVHAGEFDVVVATIFTSMPLLAEIAAWYPDVTPAYYVQDYEPWFFPEGDARRDEAAASYGRVPGALLFAKTRWLRETVGEKHGLEVWKVRPSLDHDVYYPPAEGRAEGAVRVAAMIRPSTPRRAAGRTMRVLRRLRDELGTGVEVRIFGCADEDLTEHGLETGFRFVNHGVLTREEVAALLRGSDVFLDLSDYQAFGRTGLEAMACGCVPVLPAAGGADEYAVDGENALVVETGDEGVCVAAARRLVADGALRERLRAAGLATAGGYSIEGAARSELELFAAMKTGNRGLEGAEPLIAAHEAGIGSAAR